MKSAKDTTFSYSPLIYDVDRHLFRLVRICPGEDDEIVRCMISDQDLEQQQGRYAGVSYRWGPADNDKVILLNERRFTVRHNLFTLLCQLRRLQITGSLWIDAICIDQTSIQERNHQVSVMGKIYRNAARVYAWMGKADDDSDSLMDFLNHADYTLPATQIFGGAFFRFLLAMQCLTTRIYWSRIWIVQELVLAQDFLLICGDKTVGLQQVRRAFDALSILKVDAVWQWTPQLTTLGQILAARDRETAFGELFQSFGRKSCAVEHDKIYALLGMAVVRKSRTLPINYEVSVSDLLYQMITSWGEVLLDWEDRTLDFPRRFVDLLNMDVQAFDACQYRDRRIQVQLDQVCLIGSTADEEPQVLDRIWPVKDANLIDIRGSYSFFQGQGARTEDWHVCCSVQGTKPPARGDLVFRLTNEFPQQDIVVRPAPLGTGEAIGISMRFWHPGKGDSRRSEIILPPFPLLTEFAKDVRLSYDARRQTMLLDASFFSLMCLVKYLEFDTGSQIRDKVTAP